MGQITRKPCCRKDDRAMLNIMDTLKILGSTPTATFPEIVNGLLLRLIVLKCVQNLKFVDLPPVPEMIGLGGKLPQKCWQSLPTYAHAPFSSTF